MALEHLRDDTKALFEWFSRLDEARKFILIGGTAMAIHVGHRQSEDLDLVYSDGQLPPGLIRQILDTAAAAGFSVVEGSDDLRKQLAENDGRNADYDHQEWFINNVKFSFILTGATPSMEAAIEAPHVVINNLKIANIEAIFRSKARLLLNRQTSRDLFDIWFFIAHLGKSMAQIAEEMMAVNKYTTAEQNLTWIRNAKRRTDDPGFKSLLPDAPKSFEELKAVLVVKIDEFEQDAAAELAKSAPKF
ncbi:MAG: hypothetical protein B0A82_08915 [Alkalinema sp. CACIAM 70d]|nr:MAG: hypothetical protein B0A82_08915 [Alkalinema sp. CACIAM 70d]